MSAASSFSKRTRQASVNGAKQTSLIMRVFADNHENRFPTEGELIQQLRQESSHSIGDFEYVEPGAGWQKHPNAVVLRQRIVQQTVNGTWERIYAFADGSVQTALSNDGNFDAWEKINTYSPATNQNQ